MKTTDQMRWWRMVAIALFVVILVLVSWKVVAPHLVHPSRRAVGQTIGKVEQDVRSTSTKDGPINEVKCVDITRNVWNCVVRYVDGRVVLEHAVWYPTDGSFGISVVQSR